MKIKHREFFEIKNKLGRQNRSPLQKNDLFQSDCEILQLGARNYLATSIDSVGEEISMGLYKDVETWAWMTFMSSVSDLAASGTKALGLTLSTQWAFGTSSQVQRKFFSTIHKASKKSFVPLLGGDSGWAKDHVFTSSILGQSQTLPLQRIGAEPGDYLVLAHKNDVGLGPALAYAYLIDAPFKESLFRPCPSWKLTYQLRPWIKASIDTSDGIATSLSLLSNLNEVGFKILWNEKINSPQALKFCKSHQIPSPLLWMGDHGDFQTLLVVAEKNLSKMKGLTILGQLTREKKYLMDSYELPLQEIVSCGRDLKSYKELFREMKKFFSLRNIL